LKQSGHRLSATIATSRRTAAMRRRTLTPDVGREPQADSP
jgi:hypothetical protein